MSYILDALRRADAERQRGGVPGLHAPVLPGPAPASDGEPAPSRRGVLLAAAALLLVAGLGAGWYFGRTPPAAPRPGMAGSGDTAVAPTATAPAAAPALPGPAPSTMPVAPAAEAPPVAAAPAHAPPQAAPLAMPQAAPQTAPQAAAQTVPQMANPVPPAQMPPPTPAQRAPATAATALTPAPRAEPAPLPAPGAPEARLPTWAELPDALRRELPALSLGGAMHAEQAELRVAIINGQVFHEGDAVAPGLTLRSIRPKAVVFDFRGQRFEMPL